MPRVGFEFTIPAFERAKRVHALDGAATVNRTNIKTPLSLINQHVAKTCGELRQTAASRVP
jgi:hypothetical protein